MFPLHLAALNAHADCCRKLLSSGEPAAKPATFVCRYSKAITFILNITVKNRYVQIRDILVSRHSSVSEASFVPRVVFLAPSGEFLPEAISLPAGQIQVTMLQEQDAASLVTPAVGILFVLVASCRGNRFSAREETFPRRSGSDGFHQCKGFKRCRTREPEAAGTRAEGGC